jgi:hypothetical protein
MKVIKTKRFRRKNRLFVPCGEGRTPIIKHRFRENGTAFGIGPADGITVTGGTPFQTLQV